jgi:hypothetical protein
MLCVASRTARLICYGRVVVAVNECTNCGAEMAAQFAKDTKRATLMGGIWAQLDIRHQYDEEQKGKRSPFLFVGTRLFCPERPTTAVLSPSDTAWPIRASLCRQSMRDRQC